MTSVSRIEISPAVANVGNVGDAGDVGNGSTRNVGNVGTVGNTGKVGNTGNVVNTGNVDYQYITSSYYIHYIVLPVHYPTHAFDYYWCLQHQVTPIFV